MPFPLEADFRLAEGALPYPEGFPRDRVRGMIVTNTALLRARGLAHPDAFISTFFGGASLTLEHLFAIVDGLPPGISELMCHPGYDDPDLAGRRSVPLTEEVVVGYDAVLVATDHSLVDYALVARAARLLLDTRNVFAARGILPPAGRFVKI